MPVAQSAIPGVDTAIQVASHDSYEAVLVVIVLVVMLGCGLLLGRWFIKSTEKRLAEAAEENSKRLAEAAERETRMAKRIDDLESFIQTNLQQSMREMTAAMTQSTEAWRALIAALDNRPCLAMDVDSLKKTANAA